MFSRLRLIFSFLAFDRHASRLVNAAGMNVNRGANA
jgi:hypothetical protein